MNRVNKRTNGKQNVATKSRKKNKHILQNMDNSNKNTNNIHKSFNKREASMKLENMNKKKVKKPQKRKRRLRVLLLFVLLVMVLSGVILGVKVYKNGGGLQGFLSAILGQTPETLEDLDTIYVLVMGVSEDLDSKLTDTMILCAYNPKQQKASMLSIPRDTFVGKSKSNAKGTDKINSLYSINPEKTLEAVSDITGINIEYYAVVNTVSLIKIVDIIGGVDFDVPIDMKYDDKTQNLHINLKAGMQKIDGEKAEQLLRFRHSNPDKNGNMTTYPSEYGNDDYGRMKTQRAFIIETAKQTLNFKNITKIKELMTTIFDNVETNLTLEDVLPYAPYVVSFNTEDIDSEQLPGESEKCNELWFFIHDKKQTQELIEQMKSKLEGIQNENIVGNEIESDTSNSNIKDNNTSSKNTSTKNNSKTNTTQKTNNSENTTKKSTTTKSNTSKSTKNSGTNNNKTTKNTNTTTSKK